MIHLDPDSEEEYNFRPKKGEGVYDPFKNRDSYFLELLTTVVAFVANWTIFLVSALFKPETYYRVARLIYRIFLFMISWITDRSLMLNTLLTVGRFWLDMKIYLLTGQDFVV